MLVLIGQLALSAAAVYIAVVMSTKRLHEKTEYLRLLEANLRAQINSTELLIADLQRLKIELQNEQGTVQEQVRNAAVSVLTSERMLSWFQAGAEAAKAPDMGTLVKNAFPALANMKVYGAAEVADRGGYVPPDFDYVASGERADKAMYGA